MYMHIFKFELFHEVCSGFTDFWQSDYASNIYQDIFPSAILGPRFFPCPIYVAKVEMEGAKMAINVGLFFCFPVTIDLDPYTYTHTHTIQQNK